MVTHNTRQVVFYTLKRMTGARVSLRRRADGLLAVRSVHVRSRKQVASLYSRRSSRRRARLRLVMALATVLSLLVITGIALMDQFLHVGGPVQAATDASAVSAWNLDVSSDLLFVAGVPFFAALAALQVYLLFKINSQLARS